MQLVERSAEDFLDQTVGDFDIVERGFNVGDRFTVRRLIRDSDRTRPGLPDAGRMMKWLTTRSLWSTLLLGSLLWTTGVMAVAHLATAIVIYGFPPFSPLAHRTGLSVLALGCIAAGIWKFKQGLAPFDELRRQLAAVRDGKSDSVKGNYPSEVEPLVDDLNSLLAHRERRAAVASEDGESCAWLEDAAGDPLPGSGTRRRGETS